MEVLKQFREIEIPFTGFNVQTGDGGETNGPLPLILYHLKCLENAPPFAIWAPCNLPR